jgi:acyl-coenzyme A thioesterase PaaI-like protein
MTQLHDAGSASTGPGEPGNGDRRPIFVSEIPFGFELAGDGVTMVGDATVSDALRSPGSSLPRPSVLATIADCIAGIPACFVTTPALAVTLDISVHMVAEQCGDDLTVRGEIVKPGRSTVASEIRFSDARTALLVATSYVTFMASPRPQDNAPPLQRGMRTSGSMPVPFPDFVGTRLGTPGVAEVDLTPFVMQASGTLQGGVVAMIGEVAAETLTGSRVLSLDIRYLSAVRVGPGRATATPVGENLVRVEVRDAGSNNRLAALIFARVAPAG